MNLAWILLLAQMSSPARPSSRTIQMWRDTDGIVHAVNSIGQEIRSDGKPPKPEPTNLPHDVCLTCGRAAYPYHPAAASPDELMDVPALGYVVCRKPQGCTQPEATRWTCADETRVLLTSEDGKKHCIKFPGE